MHRCFDLGLSHGKPVVQLLEGVGHRISEGLDSRLFAEGVDTLAQQCQLSGTVPNVAAILGQSFAAMTLVASLCDFVVMVRGVSAMGIAPPALVKAATGEDGDTESLGGADLQANQNGVADYVAETEIEAFDVIKRYLTYFPNNASEPPQ
jgi:acetyl-CoA carboxylase carboxyltransferase component